MQKILDEPVGVGARTSFRLRQVVDYCAARIDDEARLDVSLSALDHPPKVFSALHLGRAIQTHRRTETVFRDLLVAL